MTTGNPYSGSFSRNGEYLFFTTVDFANTTNNYAYKIKYNDLRAGNIVPKYTSFLLTNTQIASDRKLYGTSFNTKDLHVILDPNSGGTDIRKFNNYLLSPAQFGLPNFSGAFFSPKARANAFSCSGYEDQLEINISMDEGNLYKKLIWDFGDNSPRQ